MDTLLMINTINKKPIIWSYEIKLKAVRNSDNLSVLFNDDMILINAATSSPINLNINNTDEWTIEPYNGVQVDFMTAFNAWANNKKDICVFSNNTPETVLRSTFNSWSIRADHIRSGVWYILN